MFYLCESTPVSPLPVSEETIRREILPQHVRFVAEGVERGLVLFGGPKTEGGGGFLLVRAPSAADCQAFLDTDPMVRAGAQRFRVSEFQIFEHHPCMDPVVTEQAP